jgi:hypothetical protein
MTRDEGQGPLAAVGRIGIGRVETVGEPHGLRVTIPIRSPRGTVETLLGTGSDLGAAIAAALGPLATIPFAVESMSVIAGRGHTDARLARVLVRSHDADRPRYAAGHAAAGGEATAAAVATLRALAAGGYLDRRLLPAGARDVETATERIMAGIGRLVPAAALSPETAGAVRELVARELNRFGEGQAIVAAHSPDPAAVLTRFDAQAALLEADGGAKTSDTGAATWWEWFPGLDNDPRTLRDVLAEMPSAPATAIPWIVRLFENDKSWLGLHGAVDLRTHDMIHVLLGRGLLDQDEAFVIGFTMGSTRAVTALERWVFRQAVSTLYPEPYRIPRKMLAAYDLGLEAGAGMGVRNLHRAIRDEMLDRPLGETRRALGIDTSRLREFYARERAALPGTLASQRLPAAG